MKVDPYFKINQFLNSLICSFDSTGGLKRPELDNQFNPVPLPTPDHRPCRQLLNDSNQQLWQAVCDHIGSTRTAAGGDPSHPPRTWRTKALLLAEIKDTITSIPDFLEDYVCDYCVVLGDAAVEERKSHWESLYRSRRGGEAEQKRK